MQASTGVTQEVGYSPRHLLHDSVMTSNRGFDTENDYRKGSPTRVLAKNLFLVSRLVDLIIGF